MEGDKTKKARAKSHLRPEKSEKTTETAIDNNTDKGEESAMSHTTDTLLANMLAIHTNIKAIRANVKTELNNFRDTLTD